MQVAVPQQHFDRDQSVLSFVRHALNGRARRWWHIGLLLALVAGSAPAHAILSCSAGAGPIFGGSFDECTPLSNKFHAAAESDYGNASVSATNGSMSGKVTISPATINDGRFYSELIADFRINGPAPSGSLLVDFIFLTQGSISGNCTNCEADLGFSYRIDSVSFSGFQMQAAAARTRTSDWVVSSSGSDNSGFNLIPTDSISFLGDTASGGLSFNAASVVGHTFRLTSTLSGNAHLTGPNASDAVLTIDSGNTALFNILLPSGYTLSAVPSNYSFLTTPILQPIPEPALVVQLLVGLGSIALIFMRKI